MRKIFAAAFVIVVLCIATVLTFRTSNPPPSYVFSVAEVDAGLENWKTSYLPTHLSPMNVALYVMAKGWLQRPVTDRQSVIDYFNNNQEVDGGWAASGTMSRMFTTHRVLLAYIDLNTAPVRSLDDFFLSYDTWEEVQLYYQTIGPKDPRNVYHIVYGWKAWFGTLPSWLPQYFTLLESDLAWTDSTDLHKMTHLLYPYCVARRPFPNVKGLLESCVNLQQAGGGWMDYQTGQFPTLYTTNIALLLLSQIQSLNDFELSTSQETLIREVMNKSINYYKLCYKTDIVNGTKIGYFESLGEMPLVLGIMGAITNHSLQGDSDPTFSFLASFGGLRNLT